MPLNALATVSRALKDDDGAAPDERCDILIVDDLPEKLLVFGTVLEDLGQNLVFVRSGAEALREVLNREFAVILLDVNMPDIDGFETASLIRQYKRSAHTPIIFITAFADEMQTARGYSLGAVDYILSPVVPDVLRSKVKVFVELHQMHRRLRNQADERVARVEAETARRIAEDNERRSAFLSQASRVLGASLDVATGMQGLIELALPRLGSLAVIATLGDGGGFERALAALAHGDSLHTVSSDFDGLPRAIAAALGEAHETRRRVLVDPRELLVLPWAAGAAPAFAQVIAMPLVAGERSLGAMLVAAEPGAAGEIATRDWVLLDDLASRAAIAFDNARLYRELQAEIVERRAAEHELHEANRRKDEFLAMLSHELRNPLAPIRNALEVVRRVAPTDSKLDWARDVMDRQVRHLTRLVEELLDVARISQGKIALHREPVHLQAVLAQAVETAQPFIDARGHQLSVSLPETPVWLQADAARLAQVVGNLLHNAAKFCREGGRIQLELGIDDGEATIVVRDNGIGIDEALLPRIFDLFAQGNRSLDRSQGGLGVGLTLVRRLVELHGGEVQAHSEGAGRGTEFRVVIPCISVVGSGGRTEPMPLPETHGRRVLIVDDNLDAAESVAQFLQLEGHAVKTVADGREALASAPVFAPQVVVLDIGLPLLDGYEVARQLRQLPATRGALLIALTGYGQREDRLQAQRAGFDHHLVKPADPRSLARLIADHDETRAERPAGLREVGGT